jgi:hypothetical protein
MSDVYEKKILDLIFRNANASATVPLGLDATNLWVGLFTATPSDAGGGTEVSGASYARVAVPRSGSPGWTAASGSLGTTTNNSTITFPTATGAWGVVTQFGIFDASTGGNLVYWGDLTTPRTISSGDTVTCAVSSLTMTQD